MRALEGPHSVDSTDLMAEREGFEPPIALRLCLISSQVHSTGLCHLSASIILNRMVEAGVAERAFLGLKRAKKGAKSRVLFTDESLSYARMLFI